MRKGFLAGSQTHLKFLPAQHTDFIFAVLSEEFGLLGATCVLTLFAALVIRGFWFAQRTRNRFAGFVAAGLSAVPMASRVVQRMGQQANPRNFLLMHAMGPNIAGVIGAAIAAGIFLGILG